MIELLIIVIAFILLLLVIIWAHFINQNKQQAKIDNSFRDETNIRLYHEHKAEIEKDFQHGALDEESYQYLIAELDQSLLQDIEDNSKEAAQGVVKTAVMPITWPAVISLFILVFSGYFYSQKGSFDLILNTPKAQVGHEVLDEQQQAVVQIQKLKQMTEQQPQNADAWYSLGQALVGIGEFDDALAAFDEVIAIDGDHADLFGAKAQATYYRDNQKMTPEVLSLIDKALALDARDPSTNILLGMDSFVNKRYQKAIEHWQLVVDEGRSSVNLDALKAAINEAKSRLSLTGNTSSDSETSVAGPQLKLHVSISDDINDKLNQNEDKVVFIYAIPTEGARIPVAAIKVKVSDLPLDVVLNDATAMTPQAKISDFEQVHVYAIISNSGSAGIKPGDYKAEANSIRVDQPAPVKLVISSIVEAPQN